MSEEKSAVDVAKEQQEKPKSIGKKPAALSERGLPPTEAPITIQTHPKRDQDKFFEKGWFTQPGAYVLVDGQYGSTGKGLAEQKLARLGAERVTLVTTNAGPNSGHTIYDQHGRKIVTKQIPSFSIAAWLQGFEIPLFLNAGSMIDPAILRTELQEFPKTLLSIHPLAAAILPKHYDTVPSLDRIASTQKGTGPALVDKILRKRFAVVENVHDFEDYTLSLGDYARLGVVFVSTAQGFSLGLNSGFYPYTTCRECTVQQALSDARIPARQLRKVIATFRTYPIRVGNTALGESGGWYSDQKEIDWKEIGVEPETTTVTGRQRRVATFSYAQFRECLAINDPDAFFINFLNYIKTPIEATQFVEGLVDKFRRQQKRDPDFVLLGFGPKETDVEIAFTRDEVGQHIFKRMGKVDIEAAEAAGY